MLALVAGACTDGGEEDGAAVTEDSSVDQLTNSATEIVGPVSVVVPNSLNTISTAGPQRIMTALLGNGANNYQGGADLAVTVDFELIEAGSSVAVDGAETSGSVTGEWVTTSASPLGLYVSNYTFSQAGLWEVTVSFDGETLGETLLEVVEQSAVPNVGDPAPPSTTPTSSDLDGLATISTDPAPDLELYDLSIADAVNNGQPTVVVFATPAFCQTALCGPTLDTVKEATAGRDDLDVVHVEPFDLTLASTGVLEPIPAMADWGLVTEPWVFVVDANGFVTASFEGIIGGPELDRALAGL